jgi:hypothetical protein
MNISLKLKGINELRDAFGRFTEDGLKHLNAAGLQAINDVVLREEGTPGNYPPYSSPYYVRGQDPRSEKLGTRYGDSTTKAYTKGEVAYLTAQASYASYVIGDPPAKQNARVGWKSLFQVAKSKLAEITEVYQKWVDRAIREAGLK